MTHAIDYAARGNAENTRSAYVCNNELLACEKNILKSGAIRGTFASVHLHTSNQTRIVMEKIIFFYTMSYVV